MARKALRAQGAPEPGGATAPEVRPQVVGGHGARARMRERELEKGMPQQPRRHVILAALARRRPEAAPRLNAEQRRFSGAAEEMGHAVSHRRHAQLSLQPVHVRPQLFGLVLRLCELRRQGDPLPLAPPLARQPLLESALRRRGSRALRLAPELPPAVGVGAHIALLACAPAEKLAELRLVERGARAVAVDTARSDARVVGAYWGLDSLGRVGLRVPGRELRDVKAHPIARRTRPYHPMAPA
eukprot:CAMPEP_0176219980 /NCGR_PEP_ID=MMETSP0121_2-20121125/18988_1 /TAXON_ID=160619 /ORGANISM="Kryptoperidinium foliaceum, Strain CCMP 1326" /LENGTH=241 /DNA_ID=CAMNT_0017559159 /DNA_START=22 /DNA_END=745 /DNA_ORIENTATION=-